ncbi:MAG TPA: hypothetical protein PKC24_05285 [Cyclobacteriaceae bacterium]|nr:hypothetical protein [Cyclobacteriaceae bacterium]
MTGNTNKELINIKAESFPWHVKFLGVLFLLGAILIIPDNWWLTALLMILALLFLTIHSGTEVNVRNKTLREYNSYLFIRVGETESYNEIERIFINSSKVSEKIYTPRTLNSSTFHSVIYKAYLKLDDDRKIFLTSKKNKEKLIQFLNPVATTLRTELVDLTV